NDLKGLFNIPLYTGVFGLLLSPGKGLLWYAPPVALSMWGFSRFWGRHAAQATFVGVLAASLLVFFGLYVVWPGGGSWGPRFLMPLLPFAMLPALATVEHALQSRSRWGRAAVSVVVALGFLVNVPGALINFD